MHFRDIGFALRMVSTKITHHASSFSSDLYEIQNDIGMIKKQCLHYLLLLHVNMQIPLNVSEVATHKIHDGSVVGVPLGLNVQ